MKSEFLPWLQDYELPALKPINVQEMIATHMVAKLENIIFSLPAGEKANIQFNVIAGFQTIQTNYFIVQGHSNEVVEIINEPLIS